MKGTAICLACKTPCIKTSTNYLLVRGHSEDVIFMPMVKLWFHSDRKTNCELPTKSLALEHYGFYVSSGGKRYDKGEENVDSITLSDETDKGDGLASDAGGSDSDRETHQ